MLDERLVVLRIDARPYFSVTLQRNRVDVDAEILALAVRAKQVFPEYNGVPLGDVFREFKGLVHPPARNGVG